MDYFTIKSKCDKPDHSQEDLSIICLNPSCEQKRLICLKCCLLHHSKHPFIYLNDFLIECKQNISKVKTMLPKSLKTINELEEKHYELIRAFKENLLKFIDNNFLMKSRIFFKNLRLILNSRADLDAISTAIGSIYSAKASNLNEMNYNLDFIFNSLKLNDYFNQNEKLSKDISIFHFEFEQGFQSILDKGSRLNKELNIFLNKNLNQTKNQINSIFENLKKELSENSDSRINFKSCEIKSLPLLSNFKKSIKQICFLSSGDDALHLAMISEDPVIDIYELTEKNKFNFLQCLEGHHGIINHLLYSTSNNCLVSSSNDTTIKIWDVQNNKLMKTLTFHEDSVLLTALLSDLYAFCSFSNDKTLRIWDIETLEHRMAFKLDAKLTQVQYISIPEFSYCLACGDKFGYLYWLEDLNTNKVESKKRIKAHNGEIYHLIFVPQEKILISSGLDKCVKIWDVLTKDLTKELIINEDILIPHISFDENLSILTLASSDGMLRFMKFKEFKVLREMKENSEFNIINLDCERKKMLIAGREKNGENDYFLKLLVFC